MVITVIIYILSHIIKWVSRVAQLVAQRIDYRLRPNAVCSIPVQAHTLLCGSPAQERCWPPTCTHSLAMNTRHNNPIVSQRTCPLACYERHNNLIVSQRACHWEDHPSSSSYICVCVCVYIYVCLYVCVCVC